MRGSELSGARRLMKGAPAGSNNGVLGFKPQAAAPLTPLSERSEAEERSDSVKDGKRSEQSERQRRAAGDHP